MDQSWLTSSYSHNPFLDGCWCKLLRITAGMTEPTSAQDLFKGRHFDQEIIVLCIRWYLTLRGCLKSPDSRQILSSMCLLQLPESWHEACTTSVKLGIGRTFQTSSKADDQDTAPRLKLRPFEFSKNPFRGFHVGWNEAGSVARSTIWQEPK